MNDYYHYSVNDFVMDEYFRQWVWSPDDASNLFWREWLHLHPDKRSVVEDARGLLYKLEVPTYKLVDTEVDTLWLRIKNPADSNYRIKKEPFRWWYAAAAAALLVFLATFILLFINDNTLVYQTAYGETRTVILPDSSTVMLNANSKIILDDHWDNVSPRNISLIGEAYFEVRHTKSHQPFRVKTDDGIAIEVLGTAFNVYHRTKQTKVVLTTGSVRLSMPLVQKDEVVMKPGEMVEVDNAQYSKRLVDAKLYHAWTEHTLVLDHTSLGDIIMLLQNNYGITVQVDDASLLNETVSGSMPMPSAAHSVDQIAKAFRLDVSQNDNGFLLTEQIKK